MSLTLDNLPAVWERRAKVIFRRSTDYLSSRVNRTYEPTLQTAEEVKIPSQDETTGTIANLSRGGNYQDPAQVAVSHQTMNINESRQLSHSIRSLDQLESQLDLTSKQMDIQIYRLSLEMQDELFKAMREGVASANVEAKTSTAGEYLTGTDKIEDETVFKAVGKRIDGLIYNALGQDWIGRDSAQTVNPIVLCHPWVYLAFLAYLRDKNVIAESAKGAAFTQAAVEGRQGFMSILHNGVEVIGTSIAKRYDDASSDPIYPALLYLPSSFYTHARRNPEVQHVESKYNRGHYAILRTLVFWGGLVLNDTHAYSTLIRAGA